MLKGRRTWEQALELADRVPQSARNPNDGSLLNPETAARALHLHPRRVTSLAPNDIVTELRRGPIAIFGQYKLTRIFRHVMVLSLIRGNTDTPGTTIIGVDDPWANGSRWIGTWANFHGSKQTLVAPEWVVSR